MSMIALVAEYLDHRRRLGFQLRSTGYQLYRFARFADDCGHHGPLTLDLALRWAQASAGATAVSAARRLALLRPFARYRLAFDPTTEVPPRRLLGPLHQRRCPYIYTADEIQRLLAATAELTPRNGLRPRTMRTLFGLLAATGLRVSEALQLACTDIDSAVGLLTVRETKYAHARQVPLHASTLAALTAYQAHARAYRQSLDRAYVFITDTGQPLGYHSAGYAFRVIRRRLGWQASEHRRAPRIHDLRHSFVCYRLLDWYRRGVDVEHAITALSTYLGHRNISDTYWYLTAIPELMAVIGERFEAYTIRTGERPS